MKLTSRFLVSMMPVALVLVGGTSWADSAQLGKIAFVADTNVRMFKFAGEAQTLQSVVERNGDKLTKLELKIPVNQLSTGIDIRDKHMRERVFTAADGSTPDIVYSASQSRCKAGTSSSEEICQLDGQLSFRGETHALPVRFTLKNDNEADGSAKINVKNWGVTDQQLSYTAIKVNPIVKLEFSVNLK